MEQELAHQALHDTLTGLPNRALLTDRLVHGLAGTRRRGTQLGVMFIDIDHFKWSTTPSDTPPVTPAASRGRPDRRSDPPR